MTRPSPTTIARGSRLPGILHLVDTLNPGGAERMAVSLVNLLPRDAFRPCLASTRAEGMLAADVAPDVPRLAMNRHGRFELGAFLRLRRFVREQDVRIVHAHASALFVGAVTKCMCPRVKLVWHDHCGMYVWASLRVRGDYDRPVLPYLVLARFIDYEFVVKPELRDFACRVLRVRPERVSCLPNFVLPTADAAAGTRVALPGTPGQRIVCLANLREQKNHPLLVEAFREVATAAPAASLLLIGAESKPDYVAALREQVRAAGLAERVFFLGARAPVSPLLAACDIGVLASRNEGFPVSLLEYGVAGLAVVATDVGECSGVLDHGRAGLLVATGDARALADALRRLLQDSALRQELGGRLQVRVRDEFSPAAVVRQVESVYRQLLGGE